MRVFISLSGKEQIVKGSRVSVRHGKEYWLATVNKRGTDGTIAITYDEGTKDPSLSLRSGVTHLPDGTKTSKKPLTREQVHAIIEKSKAAAAKEKAKVKSVVKPSVTVKPKTTTSVKPVVVKPKATEKAPAAKTSRVKAATSGIPVLEDVDAKTLANIGDLVHENGSGSNRSSVRSAIENMSKGTATSKDILTMVQTHNYGGPVSSYRARTSKSRFDPNVVELLKRATSFAKKHAPAVVKQESEAVVSQASKLLSKYQGEAGAKAFAAHLAKKEPHRNDESLTYATKWFTKFAANPTVDSLSSDNGYLVSVLPKEDSDALNKLRDKAHFVYHLNRLIKK